MKSSTDTIISALRLLTREKQTDDDVVNACLEEAAGRLEELQNAKVNAFYAEKHLNDELTKTKKERNKTVVDLTKQRDAALAGVRAEPTRLEIAAMLLAALAGRESGTWEGQEESIWAVEQADILIATAKEVK